VHTQLGNQFNAQYGEGAYSQAEDWARSSMGQWARDAGTSVEDYLQFLRNSPQDQLGNQQLSNFMRMRGFEDFGDLGMTGEWNVPTGHNLPADEPTLDDKSAPDYRNAFYGGTSLSGASGGGGDFMGARGRQAYGYGQRGMAPEVRARLAELQNTQQNPRETAYPRTRPPIDAKPQSESIGNQYTDPRLTDPPEQDGGGLQIAPPFKVEPPGRPIRPPVKVDPRVGFGLPNGPDEGGNGMPPQIGARAGGNGGPQFGAGQTPDNVRPQGYGPPQRYGEPPGGGGARQQYGQPPGTGTPQYGQPGGSRQKDRRPRALSGIYG